jgi:hypothetical protein
MKVIKFIAIIVFIGTAVFFLNSCKKDEATSTPNFNFKGRWVGTYESNGTSYFSLDLNNAGDLVVFASDSYYYGSGTWSKNGKAFSGTYEYATSAGTWKLAAQLTINGSDTTLVGTWTDASDASNKGAFTVLKNSTYPLSSLTYQEQSSWACSGNDCQSVWEVFLVKGSTTVGISGLTGNSIGQIALYAPGTALGGTNLLTNDTKELLYCTQQGNCSNGTSGVSKTLTLTTTGLYKFTATRNNGNSCGGSGDFQASITSTYPISANLTTSNVATQASGVTCK